tara:strand:- start:565 stop:1029 length:465 start_codon:yes stop_codon:yes gene_type:complete
MSLEKFRSYPDYKPYTVKWIDDEGNVENWLVDGTAYDAMLEMAEDKANGRSIEVWTRPSYDEKKETTGELLYSRLSAMKQSELDAIMGDMVDASKDMVDDFVKNPSKLKGVIDFKNKKAYGDGVRIHENSPHLDEDEKSWKALGEIDEKEKDNK